jgi:serine/threonine-protein kinase
MLPGGRVVLFSASIGGTNWDDAEIAVRRLDTGERISILRGGSDPRYLANGILVYGRGPDLMAVPFDPATLKMGGAPVPVVNEIAGAGVSLSGAYQYAVSDDGTLVYIAGAAVSDLELAWIDRGGRATVIASEAGSGYPRLSPDGTRIAFSAVEAGNADIIIRERARNTRSRLTFDLARDTSPIWTHDSKRIIYGSARDGAQSLYWQAADGTGTAERLTTGTNDQYPYAVTADDKTVIYIELDPTTSWNIYAMPLSGDRKPVPLLATPFDERRPSLSPDGKWMVYQSNESGQFQLFVRPFPNVDGGRWQVPGAGGSSPVWVNPREIYYRSGHTIQRVEVLTTPSVSFGSSSLAFQTSLTNDAAGMTYAVTGDTRQALVVREATGSGGSTEYRLVFNWFEDLKARVKGGK